MVLSGMNNMAQLEENIHIFKDLKGISEEEMGAIHQHQRNYLYDDFPRRLHH